MDNVRGNASVLNAIDSGNMTEELEKVLPCNPLIDDPVGEDGSTNNSGSSPSSGLNNSGSSSSSVLVRPRPNDNDIVEEQSLTRYADGRVEMRTRRVMRRFM